MIMMVNQTFVQGIFDSASCILTIGSSKAFRVQGNISEMESGARIEKLTAWARSQMLISEQGIIAEI
jgi:hypothetical protein